MLLQKVIFCLLFMIHFLMNGYSQTEVNHNIVLIGNDSSDRQVLNIGSPHLFTSAVRPEDVKYGKYNYAQASGNDTLNLVFEQPVARLTDGDLFFFTAPVLNDELIFLSVNGMDTLFPLMINDRDSVSGNRIVTGEIIGAIYRENKAFVISKMTKKCPGNLIRVNDNYCIEPTERTAVNFFSALTVCIREDLRLCNLGEWYYACLERTTLGISQMTNNYEWLDDASNAVLQVKTIGNTACTSLANAAGNTGSLAYRCCYTLK